MKEIKIEDLNLNTYTAWSKDWTLITAGYENSYNTMTASWGGFGSLWGHGGGLPVATIYVRPQRYTKEFVDREELFTLSFFSSEYRKALAYLGSHSGRDEDKVAFSGLSPEFEKDCTYFKEANLVLVCRKLYSAPLVEEGFLDKAVLDDCYPQRDLHQMYIGEIVKVLVRE